MTSGLAESAPFAELRTAQLEWEAMGTRERVRCLHALRARLAQRSSTYLQALAPLRHHRPEAELLSSEVIPLADSLAFLEVRAEAALRTRRLNAQGRPAWLWGVEIEERRRAHGLVLVVGPSNYPLFLPGSQALFALAAGNGVLVKPAPRCSSVMHLLAEDLAEAGIPSGLFRVLPEDVEQVSSVLSGVDKVVVTGSRDTGRALLHGAADHLLPVVAELSGCDLFWAHPDSDPELAASALAFALSINGGRTCMAPRRLILPAAWKSTFGARLQEALERYPSAGADLSPQSGRVLAGDAVAGPVVYADLDRRHLLWGDGLFAPVAVAQFVESQESGLEWAFSCDSALTAVLFGPEDWARDLGRQLPVGVLVINDIIAPTADPRLAFGGNGPSGFGRTRGEQGLLEMTRVQSTVVRRKGARFHLQPPTQSDAEVLQTYLQLRHGNGLLKKLRAVWRMMTAIGKERYRLRHPQKGT